MKKIVSLASILGGAMLLATTNILADTSSNDQAMQPQTPVAATPSPMMNKDMSMEQKQIGKDIMQTISIHKLPAYQKLTPEKKAEADKIMTDFKSDMQGKMSMLFAKKATLNAELMQPTINKEAVNKLVKEIEDLHSQILQAHVDMSMKMKDTVGINVPVMPLMRMHLEKQMMMHHDGEMMMDHHGKM